MFSSSASGLHVEKNRHLRGGRLKEIEKGKMEAAKRMKEKGFDLNTIADITGLTEDEIEKL